MSSDQIIFSGYIEENEGFDSPSPFNGPPGWTVYKSTQTEIYQVFHNLELYNPENQLHVVVQTIKPATISAIDNLGKNDFTISTWLSAHEASVGTNLMFIATYYPYRR